MTLVILHRMLNLVFSSQTYQRYLINHKSGLIIDKNKDKITKRMKPNIGSVLD